MTGQNLVIFGTAEVAGNSPWHVAIYRTASKNKMPELICGATIISETLIVSGKKTAETYQLFFFQSNLHMSGLKIFSDSLQ